MLGHDRNDDGGVLGALRLMDRRGIGGHYGVEFGERVEDLPSIKRRDQCSFLIIDPHHRTEITVEDLSIIVVLGALSR